MKILRRIQALRYKVPFREKVWYNLQANIPKSKYNEYSYIQIWDSKENYIQCPKCGGIVEYVVKGRGRYLYKIIGFENESISRDWLYYGDWINPIIEFYKIVK